MDVRVQARMPGYAANAKTQFAQRAHGPAAGVVFRGRQAARDPVRRRLSPGTDRRAGTGRELERSCSKGMLPGDI